MFQGRDYLKEGAIYDYRNRFYHPGLGRFLQPDPIGFQFEGEKLSARSAAYYWSGKAPEKFTSTEINLYRYCGNDPVNKSDSMGLWWDVPKPLRDAFDAARQRQSKDDGMKKMFEAVQKSDMKVSVRSTNSLAPGDTKTTLFENKKTGERRIEISWNPKAAAAVNGGSQSPAMVLGHEGNHAERYIRDPKGAIADTNTRVPGFGNREEQRIITGPEAAAARTLGETPRTSGDARFFPVENVTDR
jgi:RHS repeat-associated protein